VKQYPFSLVPLPKLVEFPGVAAGICDYSLDNIFGVEKRKDVNGIFLMIYDVKDLICE
jgi:hypothetical protein